MALKAALYSALRARNMAVADLARRLDVEERKAARLIDPRAASRLASLESALSALGYVIAIEVHEKPPAIFARRAPDMSGLPVSRARHLGLRLG